jgi:hypothetical protein
MILNLTQYRFFQSDPKEEMLGRFLRMMPQATLLVGKYPLRSIDTDMFCHEFAHCMDLVSKGQEQRLLLENFGWPRLSSDKWTVNMAKNESRVFTFQWLLQEELGYSSKSGILSPESVAIFLKQMTRHEMGTGDFLVLFENLRKDLNPYWREVAEKTVNYLVAAVDNERINA